MRAAFAVAVAYQYTVFPISVAFAVGILEIDPLLLIVSFLAGNSNMGEEGSFATNTAFILSQMLMSWFFMLDVVGIVLMCVIFEVLYPNYSCLCFRLRSWGCDCPT
jgi:hypothetical protein